MGPTCSTNTDLQVNSKIRNLKSPISSYISYSTRASEKHEPLKASAQISLTSLKKAKRMLNFTFYNVDPYVWKIKCELHRCKYLTLQLASTDKSWGTIAKAISTNKTIKSLTLFSERNEKKQYCEYALRTLWPSLEENTAIEEYCLSSYSIDLLIELNLRLPISCKKLNIMTLKGYGNLSTVLKINSNITSLKCVRNEIGEDIYQLKSTLSNCRNLTELDIGGNNIGEFGCKDLSDILGVNHSITTLILWGNNICDNGTKSVIAALVKEKVIKVLDISTNKIGDESAESISSLIEVKSLQYLFLSNNDITSFGIKYMGESLKKTRLMELDLESNRINDDGVNLMCKCLAGNNELVKLNVRSNDLSDDGCKKLLKLAKLSNSKVQIQAMNAYISDELIRQLSEVNNNKVSL